MTTKITRREAGKLWIKSVESRLAVLPYPAGPLVPPQLAQPECAIPWSIPLHVDFSQRIKFGLTLFAGMVDSNEEDFDCIIRDRKATSTKAKSAETDTPEPQACVVTSEVPVQSSSPIGWMVSALQISKNGENQTAKKKIANTTRQGPQNWQGVVRGYWNDYLRTFSDGPRNKSLTWENLLWYAIRWERYTSNVSFINTKISDLRKNYLVILGNLKRQRPRSIKVERPLGEKSDHADRKNQMSPTNVRGVWELVQQVENTQDFDPKRLWCGYFLRVFLQRLALYPTDFVDAFLPELIQLLRHVVVNNQKHPHAALAAMVANELSSMQGIPAQSNWILVIRPNSPINPLFNHSCLTVDSGPALVTRWIEENNFKWANHAVRLHDLAQCLAATFSDPIQYGLMFDPTGEGGNENHPAQKIFVRPTTFASKIRRNRHQRADIFPTMDWDALYPIRAERFKHWKWMVAWLNSPDTQFQLAMREAKLVPRDPIWSSVTGALQGVRC